MTEKKNMNALTVVRDQESFEAAMAGFSTEIDVVRMHRLILRMLTSDVDLGRVNGRAFMRSVVHIISLGLDPANEDHVSLIPMKGGSAIRFQVGFRGYAHLLAKVGVRVVSEIVHKDDHFDFDMISGEATHSFDPAANRENSDEWIGAYAVGFLPDGSKVLEWCPREYVLACRANAETQAVWKKWERKMWRKTASSSLARSDKIDTTNCPGIAQLVKLESGESAGEEGGAVPETSSADAPSRGMAGLVAATAPVDPDDAVVKSFADEVRRTDPVEAALPSPEPAEMPPEVAGTDDLTSTGTSASTSPWTVESVVVRKGPPPEQGRPVLNIEEGGPSSASSDALAPEPDDPNFDHEGDLSPEDKAEREAVEAQAREDSDEMAKEKKRLADEADQRRFEGRATEADKEKRDVVITRSIDNTGGSDPVPVDGRAYAHLMTDKTKTSELGRSKNRAAIPGTLAYDRIPKKAAIGDMCSSGKPGKGQLIRVAVPHPTEPGRVAWLPCNDEGHVRGKAGSGKDPITPAAAKAVSEVSDPFPAKAEPTPLEVFKAELAAIKGSGDLVPLVKAWQDRVKLFDDDEQQEFRDVFAVRQTELHEAKKAELAALRAQGAPA